MVKSNNEWFDEIYKENKENMLKLADRLLGNPEIAAELVHEAFLALLQDINKVRQHPNPGGWLMETLKHIILNEVKAAKYRLEIPLAGNEIASDTDFYQPSLSDLLPQALSAHEKYLLIWYYEEQLSYEQIAARLGISVNTCYARMFRVKEKYKKLISNAQSM